MTEDRLVGCLFAFGMVLSVVGLLLALLVFVGKVAA